MPENTFQAQLDIKKYCEINSFSFDHTHSLSLIRKPHLQAVNSTSWDQQREEAVWFIPPIYQIPVQPFHSIPPSSQFLVSPVAELRSRRLSYRPLSCSCPTLHLPLHTHGHKLTPVQYNAHTGLFCEANFIATPLGLSFLSFSHRVMVCSVESSSCVWTRVNRCCATTPDKRKTMGIKDVGTFLLRGKYSILVLNE